MSNYDTLTNRFGFKPYKGFSYTGIMVSPYAAYAEELGIDITQEISDEQIELLIARFEEELGAAGFRVLYQEGDFTDTELWVELEPTH